MARIGVIGCGAWGTTLAKILAENKHDVCLWCHSKDIAQQINNTHSNEMLKNINLPKNIKATWEIIEAVADAELIVIVTASAFFKKTVEEIKPLILPETIILSATKGLDEQSNKRMSELMAETLGRPERTAVLSGPNISIEIAQQKPATAVISSTAQTTATKIQQYFNNPYFRVYTNTDVIGTEYGGTLKNVIAIAAGIIDGLALGNNAKSALMIRGMVEMSRLAVKLGARPETLSGLTGMGDLITTCSSNFSRNHFVGVELAKGRKLAEILTNMSSVAEGITSTKVAHELAKKYQVAMPITEQMYTVLYENKSITTAVQALMNRELKPE